MSSIEQLETLRNAELYDDCKTLVISKENFFFKILLMTLFTCLGRIYFNT
jgi:hypothetical protein